ncbi:hypothetical protein N0V86_004795 [Didymella sp. IMI 355093]|nr:hypothetical protein N0V86_004795 [Didymella sp. IMI 355093]
MNLVRTIDEAHYKRHHDLVEQLRSVYESFGESDWTIVPVEPGDPRRGHSTATSSRPSDRPLTQGESPVSKRERKDAKCLARSANRAKVVTQEEIKYVDSILHSSEGVANGGGASPANIEEIQLIEEHLRYNANVYNSHSSRKALKRFAKIPEVDVDFESEVERVLDTFRITELVKRNFRNGGLQGKELRTFENLVDVLRNAVVEDLVLVKKDVMEIRMRRAGYLRYTNKTAYSIVEDRYTEKDWKTGERITSSASESSGMCSPSNELVSSPSDIPEPINFVHLSASDPDRRHLQHIHTRVSGDDGLGQMVIEPYYAPLWPLAPNAARNAVPKRLAVLQPNVTKSKENRIPAGMTNCGWLRQDVAQQIPFGQSFSVPKEDKLPPSLASVRSGIAKTPPTPIMPAWGKTTSIKSPGLQSPGLDERHFPSLDPPMKTPQSALIPFDVLAVKSPAEDATISLRGPESMITPVEDNNKWHPVVSQKKAKKAQREAKRKAKKVSESSEETLSPTSVEEASLKQAARDPSKESSRGSTDRDDSNLVDKMCSRSPSDPVIELIDDGKDDLSIVAVEEQIALVDTPLEPTFTPISRTTHRKHDHWTRFMRMFAVDQLTVPVLQSFEGCLHGSSCRFESHGVPDCPFHEPHCSCRLMAIYEQQDLTQGRVMLVDEDLVPYLLDLNTSPNNPGLGRMPPSLLREHTEYLDGYERGPLMKQEIEFERLFFRNMNLKDELTTKMLQEIQRENDMLKGSMQLCYCRTAVLPKVSEIKKEFGDGSVRWVEKVSRWYCTACEKNMKMWAYKALNIPDKFEDVFKDFTIQEKGVGKKLIAQMTQPGGVMDQFKSRLQELYASGDGEYVGEDVH